jgi:hypothetical protein
MRTQEPPIVNALANRSGRLEAVMVMLFVAVGCAGCGFTEDRREAEQLAEQYFAKAKAEDLDGVLALYSPRFFAATSRDRWRQVLEEQRSRCGTPQSHTLINWHVFSSFGSNAGVRTTLVYEVNYSSCRVAETLTIFKPSGSEIQIEGHFLTPKEGDPADKTSSPQIFKT